jgi:multidrug efflux pump subunit AcrA (membrane-fusion protein)
MYATVKVGVEKKADALLVPAEAVVMEKTNAFVFTAVDGKAKKNAVKLGFTDGTNTEIASGLTEQDRALIPGKVPPADGQPITVKTAP